MAGTGGVKTRHTSGNKLAQYLGSGTALLPDELPTLRSVLRQGLLYKEERILQEDTSVSCRSYTYSMHELTSDMVKAVRDQWSRANVDFQPPVILSDDALKKKLKLAWETGQNIALKKITKAAQIKAFEDKLDRLLDITRCRCDILLCKEFGCPEKCPRCRQCGKFGQCKKCKECEECKQGAHTTCSCAKESKIPVLELRFLLAQREKLGEKGSMKISVRVDMIEQKKKNKQQARRELDIARLENKNEKEGEVNQELDERRELERQEQLLQETLHEEHETSTTSEQVMAVTEHLEDQNRMDVSGLASTAVRYHASSRMAAACATAFLGDLIRAGVLPPESASLAVDGSKLWRAMEKVTDAARVRGEEKLQEALPNCVMFDSRIDKKTLVMYHDEETNKFYPRVEAEDHYTVTDGNGNYLHHFAKPGKEDETDTDDDSENNSDEDTEVTEQTGDVEVQDSNVSEKQKKQKKPAEVVARLLWNWLVDHGVDMTLTHVGVDSTTSNTGWKSGIIAWLEKLTGKKFHWLVCMLHTNELGLRKLVEELDGKTCSKTGFSGPLGKMLAKVQDMEPNFDFKRIDMGPEVIKLREEVVRDLSRDQKVLYQRWCAVRSGVLTRDVALCKSGPIVHSRWVTTAETFIEMYQSDHGLEGELLQRLETIVTYIVTVYCPMWFEIKVKHSWLEGPRHILKELTLFHLQSPEVQSILEPTLRRSAWSSHSESVLQTMICSEDMEEREFAVTTILKIRGRNKLGNTLPRPRKNPCLNLAATQLKDIIDWKRAKEPVLTCKLTKEELKQFKKEPMQVPYYCLHTQGIERAVKETTAASETVFGFDKRDGFIRGRAENRRLMPALKSKKCLEKLLQ